MFLKMNKKGEGESSSTGAIIAAVVAVLVLVIVIVSIWMFSSGKLPFFQNLPSFNQTKPIVGGTEFFRYYLPEGKLQVYDGVSWIDLKSDSDIEVNDKKMNYADLFRGLAKNYIGQKISIEGMDLEVMPYLATNQFSWYQKQREFWGLSVSPGQKVLISGGTVKIISNILPSQPLVIQNNPGTTSAKVEYVFNRASNRWQFKRFLPLGYSLLEKEKLENVEDINKSLVSDEQYSLARALIGKNEIDGYHLLGALIYYLPLTGGLYKMNSNYDGLEKAEDSEVSAKLKSITDWRDSLINQEVLISYQDPSGILQIARTCYFKNRYSEIGREALMVDLSRTLLSNRVCPYLD